MNSSYKQSHAAAGFLNLPVSGGLSVASSRFFVSGPKTGNTKQRKKDNFVGKDGGQGRWWMGRGGEKAEKGRVGRGRKNKPKKAKFVCKKKKPRKEKNASTTQFCSPPRKKSCPKEKAGFGGWGA
jgi:hypothetical protein